MNRNFRKDETESKFMHVSFESDVKFMIDSIIQVIYQRRSYGYHDR
jgi:hypothetical protein